MVLKDTLIEQGPAGIDLMAAGDMIGFGSPLIRSAARTVKGAMADNADNIIGFSVQPHNGVVLDKDGFYQATNNASVPDIVRVVRAGAKINALVIPNANNISIVDGDYLECAVLGDGSCYTGVLEEAGATAGETRTTTTKAQALEDCTMSSTAYKIPAGDVAVGATTITFSAANLAYLDLKEGDYIILEDLNGDAQLNRVKSLTSTVVTLELASTVALTAGNSDLVHKVFQVKALVLA
jgi:hypothetical protein